MRLAGSCALSGRGCGTHRRMTASNAVSLSYKPLEFPRDVPKHRPDQGGNTRSSCSRNLLAILRVYVASPRPVRISSKVSWVADTRNAPNASMNSWRLTPAISAAVDCETRPSSYHLAAAATRISRTKDAGLVRSAGEYCVRQVEDHLMTHGHALVAGLKRSNPCFPRGKARVGIRSRVLGGVTTSPPFAGLRPCWWIPR